MKEKQRVYKKSRARQRKTKGKKRKGIRARRGVR